MIASYVAWVVPRGEWVETYPTTNGKIIVGIRLAFAYVVMLILAAIADSIERFHFTLSDAALSCFEMAGWFIGGLLAIGVGQFIGKRATVKPELQPTVSETVTGEPSAPAKAGPAVVTPLPPPAGPPGATRAVIEVQQPQTATVAASHSFDPGA